jgi:integrase
MDNKIRLTSKSVRGLALPRGKQEAFFWDTDVSGFGVRLRQDRQGVFVFQYKIGGQHRRKTLGTISANGDITVPRKRAETLRAEVTLGKDPVAIIRNQIAKADQERLGSETLGAAVREYLAWQKSRSRKRGRIGLAARWQQQVEQHLLVSAATLHRMRLNDISRANVVDVINSVRGRGQSVAGTLQTVLGSFFAWAIKAGKATANPVIGTQNEETTARDRVLAPAELRAIWRALDSDQFGTIIKLLLLTAQRRGEIGGLRYSEMHDHTIVLPAERTKNALPHVVPLSDYAHGLIKLLPRRADTAGKLRDLVFGSGEGPFTGWSKAKKELDAEIKKATGKPLPDWRLHDLRRTVATYVSGGLPAHQLAKLSKEDRALADGLKVEPHVREALLNHVSGYREGVSGVYDQSTYESAKRAAVDKWTARLLEIVGETAPKKRRPKSSIVELRAAS